MELYEEMTRSSWHAEHPPECGTVYIFEHLASWGWRLHSSVRQADGATQYIRERACDHEPCGCCQEESNGQAEG